MLPASTPSQVDDKAFDRIEAMIYSMTKEEREKPSIINPKRKRRIAAGSGTTVADVNKLLKQFEMMQKMMKQFKKSPKGFARRLGGMMGNPNAFRGLKCTLIRYNPLAGLYNINNAPARAAQNNFWRIFTMAVKIRLRRVGAKKAPFYRVVVADSRFPRDGRFIEEIGTYDPNRSPQRCQIDAEKAKQWIANGAQPTDTVRVLLKKAPYCSVNLVREGTATCRNCLLAVARGLVEDKDAVKVTVDEPARMTAPYRLSPERGRGRYGPRHRQAGPYRKSNPRGDARGCCPPGSMKRSLVEID